MVSVASLFAQVLSLISRRDFRKSVRDRQAEKAAKGFSCWDQFVAILFCQLGYRGTHTTDFSFFRFGPGFFGTKSRPVAALICSTKLRPPSGRPVDS